MRIAYVIPGCSVSGGMAVICQHANRLLARGHDVYLIAETVEAKIDWFPNQSVPVLRLDQYPENVDILVATAWLTSYRIAYLPARKKFYFVQSDETRFHAPESVWQHLTTLSYLNNYRYITEAKWIQRWLHLSFGHDSCLIPNGLDSDIFHKSVPLSPKSAKRRILLEGAIALPYKGMKEAFEAVSALDVEVWCVSSLGKPESNWKCDRFFEQVPMSEMKGIYSSCDILLKLSRVEGFFGPPMEMMACGGAVVVGRVTGYDEYILDEYNALVVDPLDIQAATNALQRLINDKSTYNRLVENGQKTAREWTWDKSIDDLEACYHESLSCEESVQAPLAYITDPSRSISFFYYAFKGDISLNIKGIDNLKNSDAAERICLKLKNIRLFRFISSLLIKAHSFIKYGRTKHKPF